MIKPEPYVLPPVINFMDMMGYIEKKYNVRLTDYNKDKDKDAEYQNYWHFMLDCFQINNGAIIREVYFSDMIDCCDHEWQKEITQFFINEFGEGPFNLLTDW